MGCACTKSTIADSIPTNTTPSSTPPPSIKSSPRDELQICTFNNVLSLPSPLLPQDKFSSNSSSISSQANNASSVLSDHPHVPSAVETNAEVISLVSEQRKPSPQPGDAEEEIYKRIRPIGRGVSSTVYLAINCKSLQYVAIKDLESDAFVSEEIGALYLCRAHPCLVHVKDVYLRTPTTWSIVTEYVEGTSWGRSFSPECMSAGPREPYSVGVFLRILRDVLRGLQFLHNVAKVAHMDIKPENVMVLSKPSSATDVHAKIIDLGLCRPATTLTTSSAGTLYYSSPEKMLGNKTNRPYCPKAADIWAVGISCLVVLFEHPHPKEQLLLIE